MVLHYPHISFMLCHDHVLEMLIRSPLPLHHGVCIVECRTAAAGRISRTASRGLSSTTGACESEAPSLRAVSCVGAIFFQGNFGMSCLPAFRVLIEGQLVASEVQLLSWLM